MFVAPIPITTKLVALNVPKCPVHYPMCSPLAAMITKQGLGCWPGGLSPEKLGSDGLQHLSPQTIQQIGQNLESNLTSHLQNPKKILDIFQPHVPQIPSCSQLFPAGFPTLWATCPWAQMVPAMLRAPEFRQRALPGPWSFVENRGESPGEPSIFGVKIKLVGEFVEWWIKKWDFV